MNNKAPYAEKGWETLTCTETLLHAYWLQKYSHFQNQTLICFLEENKKNSESKKNLELGDKSLKRTLELKNEKDFKSSFG